MWRPFVSCALALVFLMAGLMPVVAGPPDSVEIVFTLHSTKLAEAYECVVTQNLDSNVSVIGSVRPTVGGNHPTINQGRYKISLGLHHRKTSKMRDPIVLSAAEYEGIRNSKSAFGETSKHYLKKYVKVGSQYHLPTDEKAAIGWMRKVLTVASPANDKLIIDSRVGRPRLCLVLERDAKKVKATKPAAGGRRAPYVASLVHIHSGPERKRGAVGCLTIPASAWSRFMAPLVKRYPKADDWVRDGYVGLDVGHVTVKAAR